MLSYYGTNLTEYGHYFWTLKDNQFTYKGLNDKRLPFEPDCLLHGDAEKGIVGLFQIKGHTVCAIAGSCKDTRGGTKSLFWLEGDHTLAEMKLAILAVPIAARIINQMPFEVKW